MTEYDKLYDKTNQNTTLKKKTCYFIATLKELLLSDMAFLFQEWPTLYYIMVNITYCPMRQLGARGQVKVKYYL